MTRAADARLLLLSAALLVEQDIRRHRRRSELALALVNDTIRVHGHEFGFLLLPGPRGFRLAAASNVAKAEAGSPFALWLEACARDELAAGDTSVRLSDAPEREPEIADWVPGHWLWMPLPDPRGGLAGLLILARAAPFSETDRLIAEPLAGCYGHALAALGGLSRLVPRRIARNRHLWAGLAAALLVAALLPVRLSTLAPAEIAAADPIPITAPFNGIIGEVPVRAYQAVAAGELLLAFEATDLRMEAEVADKSLAVAEAELESLRNTAFLDPSSKAKLAVHEQKVLLQRETAAAARAKLDRHRLLAPEAGIVLFDDRFGWKGKPVSTGQRLMTLAHPGRKEILIDIPPDALIPADTGAKVELFLDMDPSRSIDATLIRLGYEARPTAAGSLAYRYVAAFDQPAEALQLGARGTARLSGESVSLGYWLLRRPLATIRQFLGV